MIKKITIIITIILLPSLCNAVEKSSSIASALQTKIRLIAIDPGFGGEDPGPRNACPNSNDSKDINLAISLKLAKLIRERLTVDVALTRDVDRTVSLADRAAIANSTKCDLFISIHCNAHEDKLVYGIETYYLNMTLDKTAVIEVSPENTTADQNAIKLQILEDLIQNTKTKTEESNSLAVHVQNSLCQYLDSKHDMIKDRGVKQAPFYILVGTKMPSILIATSYTSNPRESKRLNSVEYQKDLCEGIVQGLEKYISNLSVKKVKITKPQH